MNKKSKTKVILNFNLNIKQFIYKSFRKNTVQIKNNKYIQK